MPPISYARHRFPPDVIRQAVWLYLRFTLSYRDVEELLAERGLDVSYETILVTDELRSYGAVRRDLGLSARHEQGLRQNNRAENSHQPVQCRASSWPVQPSYISVLTTKTH
jgi:transposase-like protein